MVLPGEVPVRITEPGAQIPAGLAVIVGSEGAIPETETVIGVLSDKQPATPPHDIVMVPLPVLTP